MTTLTIQFHKPSALKVFNQDSNIELTIIRTVFVVLWFSVQYWRKNILTGAGRLCGMYAGARLRWNIRLLFDSSTSEPEVAYLSG